MRNPDIAIRVENLSKCYQIYEKPHHRLKQFIVPKLLKMVSTLRSMVKASSPVVPVFYREFWALKNVSFEIKKGETIGIIGRNGSGKSTLLQIICGTLNPSGGSVQANGRIAALLELGSGFNPEFTGRENVYMNAAVLGLEAQEIADRFEEILAFADIGEFIDQPVKTYSSGMAVRLAFAVAINVTPDILVVDEALSVGDIAFRNKCMERINKMVLQGVTILFVTHDLSTLQLLCSRVIWLEYGSVVDIGDAVKLSQDYYVRSLGNQAGDGVPTLNIPSQQETGKAMFTELRMVGAADNGFKTGEPLRIAYCLLAKQDLLDIVFALSIYRADGDWIIGQTSRDANVVWSAPKSGESRRGAVQFDALCLNPGDYLVSLAAYSLDYSVCYALTDLSVGFSVRADHPTWGKFAHPCRWVPDEN